MENCEFLFLDGTPIEIINCDDKNTDIVYNGTEVENNILYF